jgi:hypothetical protein
MGQVSGAELYLYGTIRSDPNNQAEYGRPYYQFTLRVEESNEAEATYPHNVTVLVDTELYNLYNISWMIDTKLNVTGTYTADSPEPWSPPVGFFMVSAIQNTTEPSTGWRATLDQLISVISSLGRILITLITQVVFSLFGYEAPEWVVAAIVVLFALIFLFRFGGKLSWIVVVIGILLCLSIIIYMLSGIHL